MVGAMLSAALSLGFIFLTLCDDYVPVGPPALMRRLSDEEFEDQRQVCNYPKTESKGATENRIIGGEYANDRRMPIAAIMTADGKYNCAATFITRRHLVTAAHCFSSLFDNLYSKKPSESKPEDAPPPYLLVGGVCIRKTKDRCVNTDTERREIGYVIYASQGGVDLAIVQLRKDQKEFHGIESLPACIYDTYADYGTKDPPPSQYEIYGWGRSREGNDSDTLLGSDMLKYGYFKPAKVPIIRGVDEPIREVCAKHPFFCMLPVKNESLGQNGDSGGPVYTVRGGKWRLAGVFTSHGAVLQKIVDARPVFLYVHAAVDLRPFKSDFCHILGLCIEGKSWRNSVPTLKWNSVYIAENRQQFRLVMTQGVAYYYAHYKSEEDDRTPAPFPLIGSFDRQITKGTCHAIRWRARRRSIEVTKGAGWMAQLVDPETKDVLCQAVLLGDFHAITHKKCFEDAKRRKNDGLRENKPLLYVNGACRPGTPGCAATEVLYNFVAWSSRNDRDLAIINIVEYKDPTATEKTGTGACFPLPEDALANFMVIFGYDGGNLGSKGKLNSGVFRRDGCEDKKAWRQFCLAPDSDKTSRQFYDVTATDIGGAAADPSIDIVHGLVAGPEDHWHLGRLVVVADIRGHLDDICFYTNRCDHLDVLSGYTLQNITLYDQIYGDWSLPKEDKQKRRKIHRRKKHRKVHPRHRA